MELTAGPKLNLRIAQEVMEEDVPDGYERAGDHWEKEEPIFDDDDAYTRSWQIVEWPALYSEHIAAAWRVVEKLAMQCGYHALSHRPFAGYDGKFTFAETVPLAICLAALKARGILAEG